MWVEVDNLATAAKTGQLDNVKTAFGAAGQSYKACNDNCPR
jgi:cytochrome c556